LEGEDFMSHKLYFNEIEKCGNALVQRLCEYINVHKKGIFYIEDPFVYNKGNKKLIESLYRTGFKSLKSIDDNTCIVEISSGCMGLASAVFILKLEKDNLYIVGYAKEGLIKQNIYGKALNKIKAVLENDKAHF
jgi:hypothetical protein